MHLQGAGRFSGLLNGASEPPIWDTIVAETDELVIAPTKGSIIPGWFLVVPRVSVLNLATLVQQKRWSSAIAREACATLNVSLHDVIWFEHGASAPESTVGCGVDHAHMHMLLAPPFGFDEFRNMVVQMVDAVWHKLPASKAYESLTGTQSYYVFGNSENAWVAEGVNFGSQFFRKVVAELSGRPDEWDYRRHDGADHIAETLRHLPRIVAEAA